jgi:hypothetical protein
MEQPANPEFMQSWGNFRVVPEESIPGSYFLLAT